MQQEIEGMIWTLMLTAEFPCIEVSFSAEQLLCSNKFDASPDSGAVRLV